MKSDLNSSLGDVPRSTTIRSFVSLAIVLHFTCIFFVLTANVRPSILQRRLAGVLAPYTQVLHFDPGFARLQFADGSEENEDHQITAAPKREDGTIDESRSVVLPTPGDRLSTEKSRALSLAFEIGSAAAVQRDDMTALYARSLVAPLFKKEVNKPGEESQHWIVRVDRLGHGFEFYSMSPEALSSSTGSRLMREKLYEAEVWLDEDGELQVVKRSSGGESAPTAGGRS